MLAKLAAFLAVAAVAVATGASATGPFDITIFGWTTPLTPFHVDTTVAEWYSLNNPDKWSANPTPDIRMRNGNVITLVDATDGLFLAIIQDGIEDGSGGSSTLEFQCGSDACADATGVVLDDGKETLSLDASGHGSISWKWSACCTDGIVIGPIRPDTCFDLSFQLTKFSGIDETYVASSTGGNTFDMRPAGGPGALVEFRGCSCPEEPMCAPGTVGVDTDNDHCADTCALLSKCDGDDRCKEASYRSSSSSASIAWAPEGLC